MDNKDTYFSSKRTITCSGRLLDLSSPVVMGILNVTPDSFFSKSRMQSESDIARQTEKILSEGATIIDIGAVSSRPGAELVPEEEEIKRLSTALKIVKKNFSNAIISIDTFRSSVARMAVLEYGADIINDISAGNMDRDMFSTIADLRVPYCIMHMKGTPKDMQDNPVYKDVTAEVISFLSEKVFNLKLLGVNDIIIDPGFGFGKTIEHNYELLNKLGTFRVFGLPILAGLSRKSMIYKFLDTSPEEALNGTTVVNTIALLKGVSILRVHDVKEAVEAIRIVGKTCDTY